MPVSLFVGEEEYLLQQALRQLRTELVNPDFAGLSHKILTNPDIHEVVEAAGAVTFNLGGGVTLIEVHDFAFLAKAAGNSADEKQLEELKTILTSMDDSKHVLFLGKKINRTIKFPKWLAAQKFVTFKEFKPLEFWKTDEAVSILMMEAKRQNIPLTPQAANTLVEHYGVGLQPLINELQKLSVYAAGQPITPQDVNTLSNHDDNAFPMLADWVRGQNRAHVYKVLDEILLRQHPVQLFALMETYINNLFQLRLWQKLGYSQAQMAERTKKHPFRIKKDLEEFANVPLPRLQKLKEQTVDLEWKSKSGQLDARLALEMLLGS